MKKSRKALFLALCAVLCVTVFSCASGGGGGGAHPLAGQIVPGTWTWEPAADKTETDGDTSVCRLVVTDETIGGETVRVYNLSGTVTNAIQYGLAECSITPDEATLELLKAAKAVSFKVQGDGKKYQFEAPISTVTDWGFHVYNFDATAEPVEYTIQMRMFMQPSWAMAVRFNQTRITKFFFKTRNATEGGVGDFSLKMWDLKLHM